MCCRAVFINCSLDEEKTLWMGLIVCEPRLDNLVEFFLRGVRAGGNVFDLHNDFADGRFQQRQIQRFFVGVIVVQQARIDTRLFGNLADSRAGETALSEQGLADGADDGPVVR